MTRQYRLFQMQDSGNCYKIRLLMSHLNLEYEIVPINILQGESRTVEFLARNQNGRVPTLQIDGNKYLAESNAILWYLAEGSEYFPGNRYEQALVFQWMGFEQYSHEPFLATSRYWISILKQPDQYQKQLEDKQPGGYAALEVMEDHLSGKDYFVGNHYSIADISLYAYSHVAHEGGFDLSDYTNIRRWLKNVSDQPRHIPILD